MWRMPRTHPEHVLIQRITPDESAPKLKISYSLLSGKITGKSRDSSRFSMAEIAKVIVRQPFPANKAENLTGNFERGNRKRFSKNRENSVHWASVLIGAHVSGRPALFRRWNLFQKASDGTTAAP
jgi:hypothetical protein